MRIALALLLMALPFAASAAPSAVPPVVSARMAEDKKDCSEGGVQFDKGFLTSKDVNGDGKPDYILDYSYFVCGGSHTYFCGSAGCLNAVFVSVGAGYVKVLDENVQGLTFKTIGKRPAMMLGLHGSACGKAGAEPCGATLYWNGETFSPAH